MVEEQRLNEKIFLKLFMALKRFLFYLSSITMVLLCTFCLGCFSAPYVAAYSISKYGVEAFSDALRRELSPWRVRVSIVEPTIYATPI